MAEPHPMVPRPYRVRWKHRETIDTVTLQLEPLEGEEVPFAPGQFNMMYIFGIGEIPVSMSGDYRAGQPLLHTIRAVSIVSEALCNARRGDIIGIRGPFGTRWAIDDHEGADLLFIAGGIGLAPLRPGLLRALAQRKRFGRINVLVGARSPEHIVFRQRLERLSTRPDVHVGVTVDRAAWGWRGNVGVVTGLLPRAGFDPSSTVALLCGPEVMMRVAARALSDAGVAPEHIQVSLERNMKCAVGWCGHCQLGPVFVCKDGAVFPYSQAAPLMAVRER